jgi:hypothetical protein
MSGEATSGQVSQISRQLDQVAAAQQAMHLNIQQVSVVQDQTRGELGDLRSQFQEFLRRNELDKNLQLAQTEIIAIRQQLDTEFGHYDDVRRLATGTLQAMDSGIVTQDVVREVSEERMLLTPRYWLTPALIALAAWIRDDKALAEQALGQALGRDNDKTSLFFALVLRRQGRELATARWVDQYVARQDPEKLSQEFTVIVDAVATGVLGVASRPVLMDRMDEWYERLRERSDVTGAQVQRWSTLLDGMRPTAVGNFSILPKVSPTWPHLLGVLRGAAVHGKAEAFIRDLFEGPADPNPDLRRRVDDILTNLVTRFDDDETPLRSKEAELAAVIEHRGDRTTAQAAVAAAASTRDEHVDLLTLLTNAAFYPERSGVSRGTQRLAVALTKDWISAADAQLEAANVRSVPPHVDLSIEGWRGQVRQGVTEAGLVTGLTNHIDAETAQQLGQIRFKGGPLVASVAAAIAVVLALVTAVGGSTGGAVFLLLCAGGLGLYAVNDYRRLPARRQKVIEAGEARKAHGVATLRGALAETVDWRAAWEAEIAKAAPFRHYVDGLVRDAYVAATPGHHRGV